MASPSDKRRTYESRIWRLAYLLTGTTAHATSVVTSVARAQDRLLDLDPTHLDRLVVLHSREYEASGAMSAIDALASLVGRAWRSIRSPQEELEASATPEHEPPPAAARLLDRVIEMDHQPREAWVLGRIADWSEVGWHAHGGSRGHVRSRESRPHGRLRRTAFDQTRAACGSCCRRSRVS